MFAVRNKIDSQNVLNNLYQLVYFYYIDKTLQNPNLSLSLSQDYHTFLQGNQIIYNYMKDKKYIGNNHNYEHSDEHDKKKNLIGYAIFQIVMLDIIFSFYSILTRLFIHI